MKCLRCHSDNPATAKFCGSCAAPLTEEGPFPDSLTKTLTTPPPVLSKDKLIAGKYRIIEEIGHGGRGVVYKAEDLKLKRFVALKFLPPHLMDSPELKERFLIEAQAAAALSHPNICVIYEVGDAEDRSYIAMEYIEGETLRDKIKNGPLSAENALDISCQVAAGLGEAHGLGIIHRDIKSANIMVTDKGQAKIMDFGLAKLEGGSSLTRVRTTMGTVAYMSPEQARGDEVDQRTDIWSLGVVLYEILSGGLPFKGDRDVSVVHSIVHEEPPSLKLRKPPVPMELQQVIARALKKNRDARYGSAEDMLKDLRAYQSSLQLAESGILSLKTFGRRLLKPRIALPVVAVLAVLALFGVRFFKHQSRIRWARQVALPEMEKLIAENDLWRNLIPVYRLAEKAESYIPHDPKLAGIFSKCSLRMNIRTEPPGANVFLKEYMAPANEWEYLGVSPIEQIRLPIGVFRWKIEKEGYETVLAAASTWDVDWTKPGLIVPHDLVRILDGKDSLPAGMVRVTGAETGAGKLDDFYIDKFEVANKQYKEFVNGGGYRDKKFWKESFVKDGKELTWEEAVNGFVDQTGLPGPAGWQAGDYPEGQADYPVSGLSWYEAAAYAEFVGKSLPTSFHWGLAMGTYTPILAEPTFSGGVALYIPFSNMFGKGPVRTGSLPGITAYGALDMAGNVREWCSNEMPKGRLIRGAAWGDNAYLFDGMSQAPALDRSAKNGFRCALYREPENIPDAAFQPIAWEMEGLADRKPVADSIFRIYKEQYSYDETDLRARLESRKERPEWSLERISFDAAYGGERVTAWLFLPKNAVPPYQTVLYYGGGAGLFVRSTQDIESYHEFFNFLSFLVKNGRAVLFPVYKGYFERGNEALARIFWSWEISHQWSELLIQQVKDLGRCIDYLETRSDIDSGKLAFVGLSNGAMLGPVILAVEERFEASVLLGGGLGVRLRFRPEVDPLNFITRMKTPTLMLNGKYDAGEPAETSQKPMFDLMGTPAEHKQWKSYEATHIPPLNEIFKETLVWLDKYLGPVKR